MLNLIKKIFVGSLFLMIIASFAYAAAPDTMTFKAKKGVVTFNHKVHQTLPAMKAKGCKTCHHKMEGDTPKKKCSECHTDKKDGKKLSMKDAMHKTCKDCHKKGKKGPTKCNDCHAKAKK